MLLHFTILWGTRINKKTELRNLGQDLTKPHNYLVMWCWWERWNGSCVICHDPMRGLLLERCHLRLSHSWPPWNKRTKRQTALPSICVCVCVLMCLWVFRPVNVCVWDQLRGSSAAVFAGINHAWWAPLFGPQWCKKIPPPRILERWSLTCVFSFSVSFFLRS